MKVHQRMEQHLKINATVLCSITPRGGGGQGNTLAGETKANIRNQKYLD